MARLVLGIFLFFIVAAQAQEIKPDTSFVRLSIQNTKDIYTLATQGQSDLYCGSDYPEYEWLKTGEYAYFKVDDWSDGSVRYAGEVYKNVGLMYDTHRDVLLVEHFYNHSILQLVEEKVDWFSLLGHTFVRPPRDGKNSLKDGFYDLLYNGKIKFYAKRWKTLDKTIESQRLFYTFSEGTTYYILKDGVYHTVKSKASVLSVFEDQKRTLKKKIKESKIDFLDNRENAIAAICKLYDVIEK